jgi:hypothetical protein
MARLIFHGPPMLCRLHTEPALQDLFEVANGDARHGHILAIIAILQSLIAMIAILELSA